MRIAILYSHLREFGGAERIALKQAELLRSRGDEATCFFAYVDARRLREDFESQVSRSYFSFLIPNDETLRIMLSLPLAPSVSKVFKGMDVLLCHGYGPSPWIGYNTRRIAGVEYISYVHSIPRFLYLEPEERRLWSRDSVRDKILPLGRFFQPLLEKIDRTGLVNSRFVLANSRFTANNIKEIYDRRALVCYPFVDTSFFKPIREEELAQEVHFKYKASRPLLLTTGRIAPIRRLEWLIEAMKSVVSEFPSANLVVTGEISKGNMRYVHRLTRGASCLGIRKNIRFAGFVSGTELVKLYNSADVYVHSCPHEAFGLSPVEAMACGTPAVAWGDGAGPCETVIDGETGFTAKPYDVEDFAEKVMKALAMDKSAMRDLAPNYVKENFSCERHLKTLEDILRRL